MSCTEVKNKYTAPEWSSEPKHRFSFNVYKNGTLLENIELFDKSFYVMGRGMNDVNIKLMHPSISRHHCVIQHKSGDFVYVYDLKSQHKTYLNKKAIKPFEFVKMRVGDFLRLGDSTRFYFLDGPKSLTPRGNDEELGYAKPDINKIASNTSSMTKNKKEDYCKWGQKIQSYQKLAITKKMLFTSKQKDLYDQIKLKEEKLFEISPDNGEKKDLQDEIKNIQEDLEDEIFNSKKQSVLRRKRFSALENDLDNDMFYDRTIKKKRNNIENNKSNLKKPDLLKKKEAVQIERTNLEIKKNQFLEETKKTKINEAKIEKDSLDDFMADVYSQNLKSKLKNCEKEINSCLQRESDLEKLIKNIS